MKRLFVLAVALMLLSGAVSAADVAKVGDPAFYVPFTPSVTLIAGETFCDVIGPCNFGFVSGTCTGTDTFCVDLDHLTAWDLTIDEAGPILLDAGYLWWAEVCITIPCDVEIGDVDTITAIIAYSDADDSCRVDVGDCEDPNVYSGGDYFSTTKMAIEIVESPPALYILQDSIYYVEQGAVAAYVPFSICNGDPCAPSSVYGYTITSNGTVGTALAVSDFTAGVLGGECEDVYGVVNAGLADVCDFDELTIIAWDDATGTVYDTCVQIIHVVEPVPVPLFTTPVVTILVLAMILAAAVIMKRTAISKA